MKYGRCDVELKQNIVDVINPVWQGTPAARSLYALIPQKLRNKRRFTEKTSFAVIEAENGDIIYRPQEA